MPLSTAFSEVQCYNLAPVIANGATVSGAVDLRGTFLCGIILPAALTGTTLTFQTSDSLAGTYVPVQTAGGVTYSVTVAASKYVALDPSVFCGARFLKLVSGTAEGADRTIILATNPRPISAGHGTPLTIASAPVANLGSAGVATVLARMTVAGSASLMKAKWPGPYTVTGGLPAAGSLTTLTESAAVVGGVFSPGPTWGSVLLQFAGVGAADLTATVEIGRVAADACMPIVLGNATALKSITTSGTFTANFNPFTGAAVATTTYRLFDLATLNGKTNLGELLVDIGGTEDDTPSSFLLDTTVMPYYYVLLRNISTLTEVMAAITPQP